ncbi:heavy-metal-associated domain-containing protein [Sphingomonas floccifaciens]|uniref:Heavy-metal-associated domain-containing protein n=1 Tax=Sphingomonas floccifaciens TaxID=1844115 RepID=A0ABW4NB31_9SPHN
MVIRRIPRALEIGLAAALLAGAGYVSAQIEGEERGAAPIDSSGDFEVGGVSVDTSGKTAEAARLAGWRIAQRKAWTMLSQRLTGASGSLPDGTLDSIVTGIVVENEQIGPGRYIARLGVLFDRTRAGQILGVATTFTRSPPMLVIPIMWSGGSGQVFERTTPWQQAWARYRTGNSVIDYVRPVGTGSDPLLLNVGQTGRRGRGWWRTVLDQYGASDVVMPEARLYRQYPGGPIIGVFTAFHGPDRRPIARFTLRAPNADGLNALLDAGVARLDEAYQSASRGGALIPDAMLAPPPKPEETPIPEATPTSGDPIGDIIATTGGQTYQVQFETPSVGAVTNGEAAVRGIPGVSSAATASLALGGVSVMRVVYAGDIAGLRAALEARGWTVQEGGGTLRIRRAAAPVAVPSPEG